VFSAGNSTTANDVLGLAYKDKLWISQMNAIYGNHQLCTECSRVTLKTSGNFFVVAEGGGGGALNANRTSASVWTTFRIVHIAPTGTTPTLWAGVQAPNGQWVVAENGGGGTVNANRDRLGSWSTFRFQTKISTGATTFQTIGTNQFLVAPNGGGGTVRANSAAASTWETFTLTNL